MIFSALDIGKMSRLCIAVHDGWTYLKNWAWRSVSDHRMAERPAQASGLPACQA